MNKKGNFMDIPEVLKIAFMFAILVILFLTIWDRFDTKIQLSSNIPEGAQNASSNFETASNWGFDVLFVIGLVVFVIFSMVMARQVPSSPKYTVLAVMVLLLFPFAAMILENVWDGLDTGALATTMDTLTFLPFIMSHLVVVTIIYCLLVSLALLTKDEGGIYNE